MLGGGYKKSKNVLQIEERLRTERQELEDSANILTGSLADAPASIKFSFDLIDTGDWRRWDLPKETQEIITRYIPNLPLESKCSLRIKGSNDKEVYSPDEFLRYFEEDAEQLVWALSSYSAVILEAQKKGHDVKTVSDVTMLNIPLAEAAG